MGDVNILGSQVNTVGSPARKQSRLWPAVLVAVLVVQLISLYSPEVPAGPQIAGIDKVIHILIFAAPALAALMAGLSAPWVIGILAVHAPVSELIQHFALSGRSGDPFDMLADFAGIVIGVLVFVVWNRRQP
jgi:VanZ family protein